jgi:hypothetical protein
MTWHCANPRTKVAASRISFSPANDVLTCDIKLIDDFHLILPRNIHPSKNAPRSIPTLIQRCHRARQHPLIFMPRQLQALSVSAQGLEGKVQTHRRGEKECKAVSTGREILAEVLAWLVAGSREVRSTVSGDRDKGLVGDGSKEIEIGGR